MQCWRRVRKQIGHEGTWNNKMNSGRANLSMYAEISESEKKYYRENTELFWECSQIQWKPGESVPFQWCKSLETHLFSHGQEMIPNKAVKRMLLSCIMGSARQEILLLLPTGLAFKNYDTGVFFMKLLKKFSQEKYEEGRKQEYLARKQGREKIPRNIILTR